MSRDDVASETLAGQRPLIEAFRLFLEPSVSLNVFSRADGLCFLGTTGAAAQAVIHLLYDGASVFLDRKNERALTIDELVVTYRERLRQEDE